MTLSKSDALQIDATVIIGILILLSITTISISTFPGIDGRENCDFDSILPEGWDNPIFLVSWVMGAFSVSAIIEISILLKNTWDTRNERKGEKPSIHESISDGPENAAPSSLIAMGVGFLWLIITVFIFAIDAFTKLSTC